VATNRNADHLFNFTASKLSRRDFVRQSALAVSGVSALPSSLQAFAIPSSGFASDGTSASVNGTKLVLQNSSISGRWQVKSGGLFCTEIRDIRNARSLPVDSPVFKLTFQDGASIDSSALRIAGVPRAEKLQGDTKASRYAAQLPGHKLVAALRDPDGKWEAEWAAVLREGSDRKSVG